MEEQTYRSLQQGAVLAERVDRGVIGASGGERRTYLHAMLTNDVETLQPGHGCYAAYLTPQGRMIADMRVLELGDLALVELDASLVGDVLQKLEQFVFLEDVQFTDLTGTIAQLGLYGPAAAGCLGRVLGEDVIEPLGRLSEHESVRLGFEQASLVVVSSREAGVGGFDLFVERGRAGALAAALREAGAVDATLDDLEVTRVEAGRPRFLVDMTAETIPLEAGIEQRAISFTKGCYPGQEVIIRVVHRGHGRVAKRLVGLIVEAETVPARGDRIFDGGTDVGWVTSAVQSPALNRPVALGYVQRDRAATGSSLAIVHGAATLGATVSPLPFVGADRA